jgi:hypothetical protein
MNGTIDELCEEDRALAAIRARGDYVIGCAIDWIGRFHLEFPGPLISRLVEGIRDLTRSMHERSHQKIENQISALLGIQSSMLLLGSKNVLEETFTDDRSFPIMSDVPRVHNDWSFREHQFASGPDKVIEARKGSSVFVSYARADSAYLSRVLVHLRPLERSGRIDLWHDGKLVSGRPWRQALDRALMRASVAVLIVSANFMASDFIYENELPPLVRRARAEGVTIFPIVFGHCLLDENEHLANLQLFNDPEHPLSHLPAGEADAILVKLAKAIRERA